MECLDSCVYDLSALRKLTEAAVTYIHLKNPAVTRMLVSVRVFFVKQRETRLSGNNIEYNVIL